VIIDENWCAETRSTVYDAVAGSNQLTFTPMALDPGKEFTEKRLVSELRSGWPAALD
jgi:hypothetical protein